MDSLQDRPEELTKQNKAHIPLCPNLISTRNRMTTEHGKTQCHTISENLETHKNAVHWQTIKGKVHPRTGQEGPEGE